MGPRMSLAAGPSPPFPSNHPYRIVILLNITDTHTNDGLQIPLRDLEEETIRRASFPSSCPCLGIPVSVNRTTFHFGTTAARSI